MLKHATLSLLRGQAEAGNTLAPLAMAALTRRNNLSSVSDTVSVTDVTPIHSLAPSEPVSTPRLASFRTATLAPPSRIERCVFAAIRGELARGPWLTVDNVFRFVRSRWL